MPSTPIIVIVGSGGGLRATMISGEKYALLAGEGVRNDGTAAGAVIFRRPFNEPQQWNVGPGETSATMFDGTVELA